MGGGSAGVAATPVVQAHVSPIVSRRTAGMDKGFLILRKHSGASRGSAAYPGDVRQGANAEHDLNGSTSPQKGLGKGGNTRLSDCDALAGATFHGDEGPDRGLARIIFLWPCLASVTKPLLDGESSASYKGGPSGWFRFVSGGASRLGAGKACSTPARTPWRWRGDTKKATSWLWGAGAQNRLAR